jgi:hypothetical protein
MTDDSQLDRAARARSRENLPRQVETRLRTTLIGSLAAFEAAFGHLWGVGKPHSELTKDEAALRLLWERCRTGILDKGNDQIRGARKDLASL